MRKVLALISILLIGIAVLFVSKLQAQAAATVLAEPSLSTPRIQQATSDTCTQVISQVLASLDTACEELGRNSACYGNRLVNAELNNAISGQKFETVGDKVPIQMVKTLHTAPMDVTQGVWGVSILKLQANLPDSLPGQNVTFLVYGDTQVQNVDGKMRSFYFTSGLGNPTCAETPTDALIVKSPDHAQVTFTANGVEITIASTIVLQAEKNRDLSLYLVEGHAKVSTNAGTQELVPGQSVSVAMGGVSGLEPVGKPSTPKTVALDNHLKSVIQVAQKVSEPTLTIQGCITAVKPDGVTINDYHVNLDPQTLKGLKVGDCLSIEGNVDDKGHVALSKLNKEAAKKGHTNPPMQDKPSKPGMGNSPEGMGQKPPQEGAMGSPKLSDGMGMGNPPPPHGMGMG